jgi:hypothetical protein
MPKYLGPHLNYETKQIYCPFFNPTTLQKQQKNLKQSKHDYFLKVFESIKTFRGKKRKTRTKRQKP